MGPYLYATVDLGDTQQVERVYGGIVVEDVEQDYLEVVRFFSTAFALDVAAYHAWVKEILAQRESAEIYESDVLRDMLQQRD